MSRSAWLVGAALIRTPTAPRPRSWDDEDDGKVEEDGSDDNKDGQPFNIVSWFGIATDARPP